MAGTLTISTLSDGTNSTSSTNCIQGSAKAWVNFNGNPTLAIRASYNISSVVRNGTGDYTINFTNALADANYSIGSCLTQETSNNGASVQISNSTLPTSSALRVLRIQGNTTTPNSDSLIMTISVFR